ncbi:unnamed protein product [Parajaminaea phylloscopi]
MASSPRSTAPRCNGDSEPSAFTPTAAAMNTFDSNPQTSSSGPSLPGPTPPSRPAFAPSSPQGSREELNTLQTPAATPPIRHREPAPSSHTASSAASSAAAAAAAVAVAASSDDEDSVDCSHPTDTGTGSTGVSLATAATAPSVKERGNGWALLSQSANTATRRRSATRSQAAAAAAAASKSSLDAAAPLPSQQVDGMIAIASPSLYPSSPVNRPSPVRQPVTAPAASAVAIDCHDGLPKNRSGEGSLRFDTALSHPRELPAEGSGLRGKDENQAPQDEDEPNVVAVGPAGQNGSGHSAVSLTEGLPAHGAASSPSRKLCIRHQRMPDGGTVGKLQRSIEALPLADQTAVNTAWSIFSSSSHARRALILQGILSMCCFSQLSLLSSELALAIRIDPFCLFPREVSLKVLGHLDAISLGRAAQVSTTWRELADDDLLWRNMCEQHIERKCEKCGWGLPLLSERRRRAKGTTPAAGTPESRQLSLQDGTQCSSSSSRSAANEVLLGGTGNLKRTITAAANAAALEKQSRTAQNSRASSPTAGSLAVGDAADSASEGPPSKRQRTDGQSAPAAPLAVAKSSVVQPITRPWKSVYCERLAIERNWRRGRYSVRPLKGHTDGIMCLQFHESLSHPAFPVVITGSYDRTARVWNMDTGEELRVLRGHTRGVRCLQFDEAKLITGSMDRTLKIWNWRTGDLIRTLEGHTEGIVCLNFNDHLLASGSADSNIKIWNFKTGQCFTLRGHTDWVNAVWLWSGSSPSKQASGEKADAADNTFLFSASDDGTIRLWDLALKECLMVYSGHVGQTQGLSLVHMPEEVVETLAMGGNASTTQDSSEFGRAHGSQTLDDGGHEESATHHFQPLNDSSYYHATEQTGPADASRGGEACGARPSVPTSLNGRSAHLAGASSIPEHFYDAPASGQHRSALRQLNERHARKIEPKLMKVQQRLQSAGLVGALPLDAEMGDLEWGRPRRSALPGIPGAGIKGDGSGVGAGLSANLRRQSPGASSGGHQKLRPMLFSCSLDNTIKIWDVRTGTCVRTLFGHMAGLWALSTDRLRLATASHDSTLKVWELATGKHLFSILEHRGPVTCVQIGDDKVVSGSDDGQVNIYSFASS